MRPKFQDIDYRIAPENQVPAEEWIKSKGVREDFITPERIPVRGAFTAADLKDLEHLDYAAGLPPFLR